ncbi:MAG: metallophosphoesterase family protein [Planctomycetia bacterium]|nr:metallophosphoesterase family protein [Planctomycetia bacterium]
MCFLKYLSAISCPIVLCFFGISSNYSLLAAETIDLLWISIDQENSQTVSISWQTPENGTDFVYFGKDEECPIKVSSSQSDPRFPGLHHVRVPVMEKIGADSRCFYRVETVTKDGTLFRSEVHSFKTLSEKELRLAFIGNIQQKPITKNVSHLEPHIILLTGDLVPCLWVKGMPKEKAALNLNPFLKLVKNNQKLFASTILMPTLGNHDREIAPRGERVPGPSLSYDTQGTAYCHFFDLPGENPMDHWRWFIDWKPLSLRIAALDLNHLSDFGTSLETCHPWQKNSEQFHWFDQISQCEENFLITFQNAQCAGARNKENGEWHKMFARGTIMIAGFGHYAERAETPDGMTYFNTSNYGRGDRYPDPHNKFFESIDNFLLLTVTPGKLVSEIRDWDSGSTLDRKEWKKEWKIQP